MPSLLKNKMTNEEDAQGKSWKQTDAPGAHGRFLFVIDLVLSLLDPHIAAPSVTTLA